MSGSNGAVREQWEKKWTLEFGLRKGCKALTILSRAEASS